MQMECFWKWDPSCWRNSWRLGNKAKCVCSASGRQMMRPSMASCTPVALWQPTTTACSFHLALASVAKMVKASWASLKRILRRRYKEVGSWHALPASRQGPLWAAAIGNAWKPTTTLVVLSSVWLTNTLEPLVLSASATDLLRQSRLTSLTR